MKTFKSVNDYIRSQPEKTMKGLLELRECILEGAPGAVEGFNYNIPAYALIKGGNREAQVMMAGYKTHVGFYPHPETMSKFSKELKGYKQGKGSVQFPLDKPLPKALIVKMVKFRAAMLKGK